MNINRIKVYGAGSIGNHLANAGRTLGAEVVVVDVNQQAVYAAETWLRRHAVSV